MGNITQPTLWDKDFQTTLDEALKRIKENNPEYTALLPSDPGVTILDVVLYQLVLFGYALNNLPDAALVAFLNYLGVERKGATAAFGTVRVEFDGELPEDLIFPAGERFVAVRGITFAAKEEIVAQAGSTYVDIPVICETKGTLGNLPANSIIDTYRALPYIKRAYNPEPTQGGVDEESNEAAKERGRQILATVFRAVTASDWEQVASNISGVARAKAVEKIGKVSLYVLASDLQPMSDDLRGTITNEIEQKRIQGIVWELHDAQLKQIDVVANVKLLAGYSLTTVQAQATQKLSELLNPLIWEWGRKVSISEIMTILEGVDGIDYVDELLLPEQSVTLEKYELAQLGTVTLNAV